MIMDETVAAETVIYKANFRQMIKLADFIVQFSRRN